MTIEKFYSRKWSASSGSHNGNNNNHNHNHTNFHHRDVEHGTTSSSYYYHQQQQQQQPQSQQPHHSSANGFLSAFLFSTSGKQQSDDNIGVETYTTSNSMDINRNRNRNNIDETMENKYNSSSSPSSSSAIHHSSYIRQQQQQQQQQQQRRPFKPNRAAPLQITFRSIEPKDRKQIQQLHEEWFPVEYQTEFYDDLCYHQRMCHSHQSLYTMVATIPKPSPKQQQQQQQQQTSTYEEKGDADDNDNDDELLGKLDIEDENDEIIIACIVGCMLPAYKLNMASRQLLVPEYPNRHGKLFYIMTLGTLQEYRHLGLASMLVKQVTDNVVRKDTEVATLYLHVITLNEPAISFYENKLGFWKVQEIQDYYTIDGKQYNCFLYAKYFHGTFSTRSIFIFFNAGGRTSPAIPVTPLTLSSLLLLSSVRQSWSLRCIQNRFAMGRKSVVVFVVVLGKESGLL
jgi:ribosomal protein S18 acetylase RimI-like enzyme